MNKLNQSNKPKVRVRTMLAAYSKAVKVLSLLNDEELRRVVEALWITCKNESLK